MKDRYLGDGVYASFDGYQIWLVLKDVKNTRIALDPNVMDALNKYYEDIKKIFKEENESNS